jgi:VanZ family protein
MTTPALDRRLAATRQRRAALVTRLWRAFGWAGVAATLVLSLTPPTLGPDTHFDKLVHLTGYGVLMFWWAQLVTERRWTLALSVVLFGISIELLQGLTPDRMPDTLDALANSAGVLLGWFAARVSPNLPARISTLPARIR